MTELLDSASTPFQFQFDVTASGQPHCDGFDEEHGYVHHTTSSWTALHQEIRTLNDFGTYPTAVDANDLHVVYSHNSIEKPYHSTESSTGWSSTEILSNSNLTARHRFGLMAWICTFSIVIQT